jgi:putative flippase GtrA
MQPATSTHSNRFEGRLDGLRDHPTLGLPIRFFFRRREQVLYLAVGGWNTIFGYGVWALLQYVLGERLNYLVIVVLSWPVAVLNAYLGYRFLVFRSRASVLGELPRFSLVYLASLIANLALLPVAMLVLPFSIYVDQALFLGTLVACSYLGHRYYSFNGGRRRDSVDSAQGVPKAVTKD